MVVIEGTQGRHTGTQGLEDCRVGKRYRLEVVVVVVVVGCGFGTRTYLSGSIRLKSKDQNTRSNR